MFPLSHCRCDSQFLSKCIAEFAQIERLCAHAACRPTRLGCLFIEIFVVLCCISLLYLCCCMLYVFTMSSQCYAASLCFVFVVLCCISTLCLRCAVLYVYTLSLLCCAVSLHICYALFYLLTLSLLCSAWSPYFVCDVSCLRLPRLGRPQTCIKAHGPCSHIAGSRTARVSRWKSKVDGKWLLGWHKFCN